VRSLLIPALILCLLAPAAATPAPPVPQGPGHADWAPTLAQARDRAKKERKVVFVELASSNCADCDRMDRLLYPAVDFEMTLLRMVPVKLSLDAAEAAPLRERYGIREAPATLILAPGGALILRLEGFESAPEFYERVRRAMADWDRLNLRIVHEPETIDDPAAELELGRALYERFDAEGALPRLKRAASSPRADRGTRETALAYLASAQLDLGRIEAARVTAEELLSSTKNPALREQAELFRAQISLAEGDPGDARKRFEAFLEKHPDSPRRSEVQELLRRLDERGGPSR
jgi:tetratricopeptide (TPR) repeat protein